MFRVTVGAVAACFVLFALAAPEAAAQRKKVEVTKKWSGSVSDEKLAKPESITSSKGLETVWKSFKIEGEMPKVDFTKDIVVGVYSVGSKLNFAGANLDDKGNLTVLGFGTSDIAPGFRFVLGVVSREGVKTVNGKALPND